MIFSFDLSERCTGACCFNLLGELLDFTVVANGSLHDEDLFIYNVNKLIEFIEFNIRRYNRYPVGFVTEALALHAKSGDRDKLFGQFWYFQCKLKEDYNEVPRGKITVSEWRSSVLTKTEQREAKKKPNGLKEAVFDKLPEDIKVRFLDYLEKYKEELNVAKGLKPESKSKKYLEAKWDLADSAFLGWYRLSLEDK